MGQRLSSDLTLGPVRVRLELLPIAAGLAFASVRIACGFVLSLAVHELAHLFVARRLGERTAPLTLQLAGGGSYVRTLEGRRRKAAVLAAGPLVNGLLAALARATELGLLAAGWDQAAAWARDLAYTSVVWALYQASPFPPLDGGRLLRLWLEPRLARATWAWYVGWALGFAEAIGLVLLDSHQMQPVLLLTGAAIVLGRAEAGYVRHLDAYAAWQRGDHRDVLDQVRRLPEHLEISVRHTLLELGIFAAIELGDEPAFESLAEQLPSHRPVVMQGAEWLLSRKRPFGAKLAQRALDALDAELVRPESGDLERFADLAFRFALYEVGELRGDSALGLLERAVTLGFRDLDRLEADSTLAVLRAHPRYQRLRADLERA